MKLMFKMWALKSIELSAYKIFSFYGRNPCVVVFQNNLHSMMPSHCRMLRLKDVSYLGGKVNKKTISTSLFQFMKECFKNGGKIVIVYLLSDAVIKDRSLFISIPQSNCDRSFIDDLMLHGINIFPNSKGFNEEEVIVKLRQNIIHYGNKDSTLILSIMGGKKSEGTFYQLIDYLTKKLK